MLIRPATRCIYKAQSGRVRKDDYMEKKIVKADKDPQNPLQLIEKAIESNVSVDVMERLYKLQQEYKADKAREAFVQAKLEFQGKVPTIATDKTVLNKDGRTVRYQYASLPHIVSEIRGLLKKHGLAYSWDVVHEGDHMRVTCALTHSMGHSETSTLEIPIASDSYMTTPQKYASAQTYAKRYTLINVLGLSTADEDTDATDVAEEKDVKNDKSRIMLLLRGFQMPITTKEEIAAAVKEKTGLALEEKNFGKIITKLEEARQAQMDEIPVVEEV